MFLILNQDCIVFSRRWTFGQSVSILCFNYSCSLFTIHILKLKRMGGEPLHTINIPLYSWGSLLRAYFTCEHWSHVSGELFISRTVSFTKKIVDFHLFSGWRRCLKEKFLSQLYFQICKLQRWSPLGDYWLRVRRYLIHEKKKLLFRIKIEMY